MRASKSNTITWVNATTHSPEGDNPRDVFVDVIVATVNGRVFPAIYNRLSRIYYLGKRVINYVLLFAYYPACPRKLIKETFTKEELKCLHYDTEES